METFLWFRLKTNQQSVLLRVASNLTAFAKVGLLFFFFHFDSTLNLMSPFVSFY